MAKFNTITVLSLTAALTFTFSAAAQSESSTEFPSGIYNNDSGAWMVSNSGNHQPFEAVSQQNPYLYIKSVDVNDASQLEKHGHIEAGKTYAFGYYINNFDITEALTRQAGTFVYNDGKLTLDGDWDRTFNFNTGDKVHIWVSKVITDEHGEITGYGTTSNSDLFLSSESGKTSANAKQGGDAHDGEGYAWLGLKQPNGKGIKFTLGGASGGPLPGVWATIALAGAAGTYLRRRKNK